MRNPDPGTIATRLSHAIALSGLDYEAIDNLAGTSSGHVGQIARGARKRPSASTIVAIAAVLGITAEWLVKGGKNAAPTADSVLAAVEAARAAAKARARAHRRNTVRPASGARQRRRGSAARS